ncbi:unnamed protein product [Cylindrotheca closterium]|uniref:Uncharacterized protein n=1 Tax=Cylindrotheca closterium TaxID=2856 RepID=A0AAD2PXG8_9STRA|nr:unnamed protein product [Cylindrotheca closterium]
MILSKTRLYSASIKVFTNGQGFQRTFGRNTMRGNQILFSHDSVEKVEHELVTKDDLDAIMKVLFYNEKGRDDAMAKRAYGTSKLYARTNVLRQWFALLRRLSPYYCNIRQEVVDNLMNRVQQSVKDKMEEPIFICDAQSLSHEKALGSDVAAVQQLDSMSSDYHDCSDTEHDLSVTEQSAAVYSVSNNSVQSSCNELPLKTHYITPSPDTMLRMEGIRQRVENDAIAKMMHGVEHQASNEGLACSADHMQMELNDTVAGWFGAERSNVKDKCDNTVGVVISNRGQDPINEFIPDDKLLASTFPHLFPFGKAYGRCAGNLNREECEHLLKQFNVFHCKDRRLLGYLADVKRRFEVIKNASLKLSGNSEALAKVNAFMDRSDHQKILDTLKDDPNSATAKKIWNGLKSSLALVGGNVAYGALEASKCISQTIETSKRYGSGCTFLTLSLDDVFNTRGIRAAIKTSSNTDFPAVFGNGSQYNSLDAFVADIKEQAIDQGHGTISFDESQGMRFESALLSRLVLE